MVLCGTVPRTLNSSVAVLEIPIWQKSAKVAIYLISTRISSAVVYRYIVQYVILSSPGTGTTYYSSSRVCDTFAW